MKILFVSILILAGQVAWAHCHEEGMTLVPGGTYLPFYGSGSKKAVAVHVEPFYLDSYPVTETQFKTFLKSDSHWQKQKIDPIYADAHYLQNFKGGKGKAPITFVSWFSAKAYCESKGKTLPTTDQWELASFDEGRNANDIKERVLAWYSKPNGKTLSSVGSTPKNGFGIYDLNGLIWEWTNDFNTPIGDGTATFCGGGAASASDSTDYVNFMRFSFRQSLKAAYTTANLGFRCAKQINNPLPAQTAKAGGFHERNSLYDSSTEWTNQSGVKIHLEAFKGHPVVMAMIYTSCQGVCPMIVADMKRIENDLPQESLAKTKFVLVSFDHETDTPQKLIKYAKAHNVDLDRWTLLNGADDDVRKLSGLLDVRYKKIGTANFEHSNLITILDDHGRIRFQQDGLLNNSEATVKTLNSLAGN